MKIKKQIIPYISILWLISLPAGLMTGLQVGTLARQYEKTEENFANQVEKAVKLAHYQYAKWNSHTSSETDKNSFNSLYANADSSFVLMIAQSIQPYPLLNFKGDSILPHLRRVQFDRFRKELEETRRKENPHLKEFYILRSIQYCRDCEEQKISVAKIFPLDSLIRLELKKQSIKAQVEIAFYHKKQKKYVYNPNKITENIWAKTPYKYDFTEKETLCLYFPTYMQIVWWNMLVPSIAGLGLVIISLLCYILAARILWKQKKLNELKNDFINNVTHEFKTPIATISFAIANIENEKIIENPTAIKQFTKVIKEENKRLNNQVEKVLQAAILDKQALELKKEILDIHFIVEVLVEANRLKIKENDHILLDLQAEKPHILGDKFHLSNAISNLLDNALKYAQDGIQIKIYTKNTEKGIILQIIDKGIGMSKEHLTHIFEKFYRVPTGNLHNVKGFGLGLSYVKEIVQQHKGTIQAQSKLGEGSTFTLFLPYEN